MVCVLIQREQITTNLIIKTQINILDLHFMLQLYHNFKNIEEKVIKLFFVNKLFIDETSLAELN